jgi:hypothetical protein
MTNDPKNEQSEADAALEREIRQGRKFSSKEALARLAGPGAMKGASPVSPVQQAETEIGNWLRSNLPDTGGALKMLLQRNLNGSALLLDNVERPLAALSGYCRHVLESDELLKELVRQADVEWGQRMDERPYFEREGAAAHPDDPYTIESVRRTLAEALKQLVP